jgi:cytochrome c peroxidase
MRHALALILVLGCGDNGNTVQPDSPPPPVDSPQPDTPPGPSVDDFTPEEQAKLDLLTPLGAVPADPTNAFADNAAAASLGQKLFFDKSYSGALTVADSGSNGGLGPVNATGKVSCASCHAVGSEALDDRRSLPGNVSLGTALMGRNSLGMVNSSFNAWTNWGGRFDSQWSLPLAVAEGGATMKSTRLQVAHLLFDKYRTEYDAIFPVALDARLVDTAVFAAAGKPGDAAFDGLSDADKGIINRIYANYGKALAAYMRTLVSRNAPFDRYVAGDRAAISEPAKRGLHLFLEHCTGCHTNSNFSDNEFHALAVPQTGPGVPATDNGRFQDVPALLASPFNVNGVFSDDVNTGKLTGLAQVEAQKGQFRTKSLRNIAGAAPYMHAGQFATLEEVVAFYNTGGGEIAGIVKDPKLVPLNLGASQQADLVAFLKTLTGDPLPAASVVDTSK